MKQFFSYRADGQKKVVLLNGSPARYFSYKEFRNLDRSIDRIAIDLTVVGLLEVVRNIFGAVYIQVANRNSPAGSYHNPDFGDSCAIDFDVGNAELGTVDYRKVVQLLETRGAKGLGLYDYTDLKGKHTHFIHFDMRGGEKSFWVCTSVNPDGTQKLDHVKSFYTGKAISFPEPKRNLKWIRLIKLFRMKGEDVKWVQTALNLINGNTKIDVDGDFAGQTHQGVWDFQKSCGLTGRDLDGVVGPVTLSLMKSALNRL